MNNKNIFFKTIESADVLEFDELILKYIKMGWKKIDGSYSYSWKNQHSEILKLDTSKFNYIQTFDNGEIKILGNFLENKKIGKWYSFNLSGNLHQEVNFENGKEDGEWIYYKSNGSVKKKEIYKNGTLLEFLKDGESIKFQTKK